MVFSSTLFIFCFFPIVLALYFAVYKTGSIRIANIVLLVASMFFYAWGGLNSFLVLVLVTVVNYALTILMERVVRCKKMILLLIVAIDIGNLMYFKYFNFFVDNIRGIGRMFEKDIMADIAAVALPIGISFYTFQVISYVADVYMGKVKVQKNLINLALYVMMFPQLVAGPIVRYEDINEEIDSRLIKKQDVEAGIKRFIIGFAKKIFIANSMGNMADTIFGMTGTVNCLYAWLGAICYTLQIYFDFSAYSDMAIGLGRIFGFHFNENFNLPYISQSIQEFWRRWHISLSSWFRDYVYIPLGGNRKGVTRTYLNLGVVFFLTGSWHGAAWQFIVWGLYHGFFSVIERLGLRKILDRVPRLFRHVYTLIVVVVGWVFFRADNLTLGISYIKNMFSLNFSDIRNYEIIKNLDSMFVVCLFSGIILSVSRLEFLNKIKGWNNEKFVKARYLVLWIVSVLYMSGLSYNPFIYFKF